MPARRGLSNGHREREHDPQLVDADLLHAANGPLRIARHQVHARGGANQAHVGKVLAVGDQVGRHAGLGGAGGARQADGRTIRRDVVDLDPEPRCCRYIKQVAQLREIDRQLARVHRHVDTHRHVAMRAVRGVVVLVDHLPEFGAIGARGQFGLGVEDVPIALADPAIGVDGVVAGSAGVEHMGLLAQGVVLVGAEQGARGARVVGDALPLLGDQALVVVRAVVIDAHGVGALHRVPQCIVLGEAGAVGAGDEVGIAHRVKRGLNCFRHIQVIQPPGDRRDVVRAEVAGQLAIEGPLGAGADVDFVVLKRIGPPQTAAGQGVGLVQAGREDDVRAAIGRLQAIQLGGARLRRSGHVADRRLGLEGGNRQPCLPLRFVGGEVVLVQHRVHAPVQQLAAGKRRAGDVPDRALLAPHGCGRVAQEEHPLEQCDFRVGNRHDGRCRVGTERIAVGIGPVDVLGLEHDVAVGIAAEDSQRRDGRAGLGAGASGFGHRGDASQRVVVAVGDCALGVGGAGEVAHGVIAVAGGQVAARTDAVGRFAVFDVLARLADLAVVAVVDGVHAPVVLGVQVRGRGRGATRVDRASPARQVAGSRPTHRLRILDAHGDVARHIETLGGQVAQCVDAGHLLAAAVVEVGAQGPGAGVLLLCDLGEFTEGVVGVAGGLATLHVRCTCRLTAVIHTDRGFLDLDRPSQAVIVGQDLPVVVIQGIDGALNLGRAQACWPSSRQAGACAVAGQDGGIAKGVALIARGEAQCVHFVGHAADEVVGLVAAIAADVAVGNGVAQGVVGGLGVERLDGVVAAVDAIDCESVARGGVHAHGRIDDLDLATDLVVHVGGGALFRAAHRLRAPVEVAKGVVLEPGDDAARATVGRIDLQATVSSRDDGRELDLGRCLLHHAAAAVVGIGPHGLLGIGVAGLVAQHVVGPRFREAHGVSTEDAPGRVVREALASVVGGEHDGCGNCSGGIGGAQGNGQRVLQGAFYLVQAVVVCLGDEAQGVDAVDHPTGCVEDLARNTIVGGIGREARADVAHAGCGAQPGHTDCLGVLAALGGLAQAVIDGFSGSALGVDVEDLAVGQIVGEALDAVAGGVGCDGPLQCGVGVGRGGTGRRDRGRVRDLLRDIAKNVVDGSIHAAQGVEREGAPAHAIVSKHGDAVGAAGGYAAGQRSIGDAGGVLHLPREATGAVVDKACNSAGAVHLIRQTSCGVVGHAGGLVVHRGHRAGQRCVGLRPS
ncbi:hypothetical protein D3C71_925880 [compost metagenome]